MSVSDSNSQMTQYHSKPVFQIEVSNSIASLNSYFCKMVVILSSSPSYTTFVTPSDNNAVSLKISSNPKFWPYFKNVVGAINGSHIPIAPPCSAVTTAFQNCKGFLSQNCLCICNFNLQFTYALTGWEGSASDAQVYDNAILCNLCVPEGKLLLADLGFPSRQTLLVPYRGVQYHLAEWGQANVWYISPFRASPFINEQMKCRPINKEELFNLWHASARNAVERSFGVLKNHFQILLLGLPYPLNIQSCIPVALCAIHNFICLHETDEEFSSSNDDAGTSGGLDMDFDDELAPEGEDNEGMDVHSTIADEMWQDYVNI